MPKDTILRSDAPQLAAATASPSATATVPTSVSASPAAGVSTAPTDPAPASTVQPEAEHSALDPATALEQEGRPFAGWKLNVLTILTTTAVLGFCFWAWWNGHLKTPETMQRFVLSLGFWAPLVFGLINIAQVVLPIIPGGLTLGVGVLCFGPVFGFIYNYVSICLGSMFVFYLSRVYGRPLVVRLVGAKALARYEARLKHPKAFRNFFAIAILLPVAPDDLLCYLAGLGRMSWKTFLTIIWCCKPPSVLLYSLGISEIMKFLWGYFA